MIILTVDDFNGFFQLAHSTEDNPLLLAYIDEWERTYIYRLLGVDLGKLFIADLLNGVPQSARFLAIFNPFAEQVDNGFGIGLDGVCNCWKPIFESKGMKEMLSAFVFFQYVSKTQLRASQSGAVLSQSETAGTLNPRDAMRFGESKWNRGLVSYESIQWYCKCFKPSDYPEYKGLAEKVQYRAMI